MPNYCACLWSVSLPLSETRLQGQGGLEREKHLAKIKAKMTGQIISYRL